MRAIVVPLSSRHRLTTIETHCRADSDVSRKRRQSAMRGRQRLRTVLPPVGRQRGYVLPLAKTVWPRMAHRKVRRRLHRAQRNREARRKSRRRPGDDKSSGGYQSTRQSGAGAWDPPSTQRPLPQRTRNVPIFSWPSIFSTGPFFGRLCFNCWNYDQPARCDRGG